MEVFAFFFLSSFYRPRQDLQSDGGVSTLSLWEAGSRTRASATSENQDQSVLIAVPRFSPELAEIGCGCARSFNWFGGSCEKRERLEPNWGAQAGVRGR